MSNIILTTRLHMPSPRWGIISRECLLSRLSGIVQPSGLTCCLTLFSAPAGFGKTTQVGILLGMAALFFVIAVWRFKFE